MTVVCPTGNNTSGPQPARVCTATGADAIDVTCTNATLSDSTSLRIFPTVLSLAFNSSLEAGRQALAISGRLFGLRGSESCADKQFSRRVQDSIYGDPVLDTVAASNFTGSDKRNFLGSLLPNLNAGEVPDSQLSLVFNAAREAIPATDALRDSAPSCNVTEG